ncbi:MAG: FAD/NAD(P)-binding protein [Rhodospirillales bacterium]
MQETGSVVTLDLALEADAAPFEPGQFNMLYAFGVGEVAISVSGDAARRDRLVHTIRAVGPVSRALTEMNLGEAVGVRGPFGSSWPLRQAVGSDVLVIAGGIGMAPLRPALYHLLRHRLDYGRVALIYGARSPEELLFRQELEGWRRDPDLQVRVTVDRAGPDWMGDVGLVTKLLPKVRFQPPDSVALICGPEPMIRFTAAALEEMGVQPESIFLSMERNMKCAVGHCGHCQFGPHFICKDGPIFPLSEVRGLMNLREV